MTSVPVRHRSRPVSKTSLLAKRFNEAQAQLVVQTADLPLGTLADMVNSKAIDLEPGFQRRERWPPAKQSALIESFLLNVPVPPIYLSEEADGRYTAIDGKQRLRAISEFMANRISLGSLERVKEAEGMKFEEFPSEIVNSFKLRPFLRVVTLLKQTDATLKYEVFLPLNRGGEQLNAQEIRNVAFRGAMNDTIYKLAENEFLKKQLKITSQKSAAYKEMNDAEYVLRFATLNERLESFSGSLVQEMDEFMERNQNATKNKIVETETSFNMAVSRCQELWGEYAFKRPEGNGWRDQLLAGMFDAQMLSCAAITDAVFQTASKNKKKLLAETRGLFADAAFEQAVRTGTNTPARIKLRVQRMRKVIESI